VFGAILLGSSCMAILFAAKSAVCYTEKVAC